MAAYEPRDYGLCCRCYKTPFARFIYRNTNKGWAVNPACVEHRLEVIEQTIKTQKRHGLNDKIGVQYFSSLVTGQSGQQGGFFPLPYDELDPRFCLLDKNVFIASTEHAQTPIESLVVSD